MADANFVVYNDAGIEQVSYGGINFALRSKGAVSPASLASISGPNGAVGGKYTFTISGDHPVLALATSVAGQSGAVYAYVEAAGSGSWNVTLFVGAWPFSATIYWYVFDIAQAPTSGPGLVIYDAAGTPIFNALQPCMRVIGQLDPNYATVHGYPKSSTPPSGKRYALIPRALSGQLWVGSYNATTGDRILNDYRQGVAGGASSSVAATVGYNCLIGTQAAPHGVGGGVGTLVQNYGCFVPGSTTTCYTDGVVVDVTNL